MSDAFPTVFCRMSDKSGLNAPETASVLREKCKLWNKKRPQENLQARKSDAV